MKKLALLPAPPQTDLAVLGLRLMFGFSMAYLYGSSKLNMLTGDEPIEFMNFLGLGDTVSLGLVVFAEFFCSILLVIGLLTRWATIPLMITMLVAALYAHRDDPFKDKEHALLFFFAHLAIFLIGPGRYSLDAWLVQRKKT